MRTGVHNDGGAARWTDAIEHAPLKDVVPTIERDGVAERLRASSDAPSAAGAHAAIDPGANVYAIRRPGERVCGDLIGPPSVAGSCPRFSSKQTDWFDPPSAPIVQHHVLGAWGAEPARPDGTAVCCRLLDEVARAWTRVVVAELGRECAGGRAAREGTEHGDDIVTLGPQGIVAIRVPRELRIRSCVGHLAHIANGTVRERTIRPNDLLVSATCAQQRGTRARDNPRARSCRNGRRAPGRPPDRRSRGYSAPDGGARA